jgi:hypothetical protein
MRAGNRAKGVGGGFVLACWADAARWIACGIYTYRRCVAYLPHCVDYATLHVEPREARARTILIPISHKSASYWGVWWWCAASLSGSCSHVVTGWCVMWRWCLSQYHGDRSTSIGGRLVSRRRGRLGIASLG